MTLGKQFASNILSDPLNKASEKHVKGVFTDTRNHKIACRFYYHFQIKGLQYERAITALQHEFDLSETRIAQLIMSRGDDLKQLKAIKADGKYLQKLFPYFNWY